MAEKMEKQWDLLVVSTRSEDRRTLLQILDSLPVNVFMASTIDQAIEVLSNRTIRLVFCEEIFANGSIPNLLANMCDVPAKIPLMLNGHKYVLIDPWCRGMEEVLGVDAVRRDGYERLFFATSGRPN